MDRIAFLYRISFIFWGAKQKRPPQHNKPKKREKKRWRMKMQWESSDLSRIKYCLGYGMEWCFEPSPHALVFSRCAEGGSLSRLLLPFCCLSGKVIIERRQAVGPPCWPLQFIVIYLGNQPCRFCRLDFQSLFTKNTKLGHSYIIFKWLD